MMPAADSLTDRLLPSPLLLACLLALAACGSDASMSVDRSNGSGSDGVTGQSGRGGDDAAGGDGGVVGGFGNSTAPPRDPDAGLGMGPMPSGDDVEECASETIAPEVIEVEREVVHEIVTEIPAKPVALYIMLDKSGSMDNCPFWLAILGLCSGTTLWSVAVDSIDTFVHDAASDGLDVALQYFPLGGGQCDGTGYATPAVPMAPLPGNAGAVTTSLGSTAPGGGTPTEGALQGLVQFCTQFELDNPDKQCIGVLITDGRPADCNQSTAALTTIVGDAYTNSGIRTFTVGMEGADFNVLDAIATAGGGDCDPSGPGAACNASESETALLEALNLIRNQVTTEISTETETVVDVLTEALECEWGVPEPPDGETLDPTQINVQYTRPDGGQTVPLGNVQSEDDCEGVSAGWYYDDNDEPTKIIACPTGCETIQQTPGGRVDIIVGCETMPAVPL